MLQKEKGKKDVDYLALSARIHAMETRLLTAERINRMIEVQELEEAAKVLAECGYGELTELTADGLEQMLTRAQADLFQDLGGDENTRDILEVFQCKYDYHNAKVLVKGEAMDLDKEAMEALMAPGGRYEPQRLLEDFQQGDLGVYSEVFRQGVTRARETLGATGDPQRADFILDRAYFEELTGLADQMGSQFLKGYVALAIDAANLRSAVRASRLNKGREFLDQVLLPGGNVSVQAIAAVRGNELDSVFRTGALSQAAALGASLSAHGSGPLTEFERLCDDAVTDYLSRGRMVPFGEEPIIGYLYARQAEMTAIRTILTGCMAGLDGNVIRQRLRRTYG